MLSDEELRALSAIEIWLEADDPRFAARCARLMPGATPRWADARCDISIALPALLAVVSTAVLWTQRRAEPTRAPLRYRRRH